MRRAGGASRVWRKLPAGASPRVDGHAEAAAQVAAAEAGGGAAGGAAAAKKKRVPGNILPTGEKAV